jgi:hypothetical protein
VTTPAVANEKDEQKTAHRAFEEDSSSLFCYIVVFGLFVFRCSSSKEKIRFA